MSLKKSSSAVIALIAAVLFCGTAHASNSSGYAWGENTGWSNFSPTGGGVTIAGGSFDGYVWAENLGWIHFKNAAPAYNVVTAWTAASSTTITVETTTTTTEAINDYGSITDYNNYDNSGDTDYHNNPAPFGFSLHGHYTEQQRSCRKSAGGNACRHALRNGC
jgi:hypothetical protein